MYDIAVKAIILEENKILILHKTLKEKQYDADSNFYDLPGGRIQDKEKLDEALAREIKEETNLELTRFEIHDAMLVENKRGTQIVMLYYLCQCSDNQVILSKEHDAYSWMTKGDVLIDRDIPEWIKSLIEKIDYK